MLFDSIPKDLNSSSSCVVSSSVEAVVYITRSRNAVTIGALNSCPLPQLHAIKGLAANGLPHLTHCWLVGGVETLVMPQI